MWQVYASNGIIEILGFCKYGLLRTITSKCVDSNETGKMYSFLAILRGLLQVAGSTAYRQLYNATLDVFPATEILMKASLYVICGGFSYSVYRQRWRIDTWKAQEEKKNDGLEMRDDCKISHM